MQTSFGWFWFEVGWFMFFFLRQCLTVMFSCMCGVFYESNQSTIGKLDVMIMIKMKHMHLVGPFCRIRLLSFYCCVPSWMVLVSLGGTLVSIFSEPTDRPLTNSRKYRKIVHVKPMIPMQNQCKNHPNYCKPM